MALSNRVASCGDLGERTLRQRVCFSALVGRDRKSITSGVHEDITREPRIAIYSFGMDSSERNFYSLCLGVIHLVSRRFTFGHGV